MINCGLNATPGEHHNVRCYQLRISMSVQSQLTGLSERTRELCCAQLFLHGVANC